MADFSIGYHWTERPDPLRVDEADLAAGPLLWATLRRFIARYKGVFTVPLKDKDKDKELEFWFDYDLAQAWDRLPEWLAQLARGAAGEAELDMASEGTMTALIANRDGNQITMRAQSILAGSNFLSSFEPVTAPAAAFLGEWANFLTKVLDALAELEPKLKDDAEWQRYRTTLMEVMRS
jgi:hypothetical protein